MSDELLKHYLDDSNEFIGLILLIQRESFKTTFTHGVFPMFIALRGKHVYGRDERIALLHHKEQQASAALERLKAKTVQHGWFKATWPEFSAEKDFGKKTEFDWPCRIPGVSVEPSVLAAGLGARLTGFHFDWMLYSDPVTEEHRDSKVIRDEALQKYQASRFMLDTHRGKEVIDGTRYHIYDLHGKNLDANVEGKLLYRRVIIKAINDDDSLSFPTRHTYAFLERRRQEELSRSGNDLLWHLQYQNEPKTSGQVVAHDSWIKYVKQRETSPQAWRVITEDCAWKGTKNSGQGDKAAIEVWALERRGSIILRTLLDGVYSNELTALDGSRETLRLMAKYGVLDVAPEEHGGYAYRGMLENDALTRGVYLNILDLKSKQTQKQMRMATFLKEMQAGRVFIATECDAELKRALVEQVLSFPQCIDDECDALDAAAYSMDPNIQEAYVPMFNIAATPAYARESEPDPRRTRHCAS